MEDGDKWPIVVLALFSRCCHANLARRGGQTWSSASDKSSSAPKIASGNAKLSCWATIILTASKQKMDEVQANYAQINGIIVVVVVEVVRKGKVSSGVISMTERARGWSSFVVVEVGRVVLVLVPMSPPPPSSSSFA